jgi:hypothetical protein
MHASRLALASLVAGCAAAPGAMDAGDDAGGKADGSGHASPFPQMPDNGGPVLHHPAVVSLTFTDDPDAGELRAFASWIVQSDWLAAIGADYGVGPGTNRNISMSPVVGPVSDDDIKSWLAANLASKALPVSTDPTQPLVYVWYLGPKATMQDAAGNCTGGYHDDVQIGGHDIAYAVVPRCASDTVRDLTSLQYREGRASHELAEAFTDPLADSNPGFIFVDPDALWTSTFGEVGDVCVWNYLPFSANGHTFYAQRTWSNAAAAAGGDPCVPHPAGLAYFNVTAKPAGVIKAHPGATVKVQLTGWTRGAHSAWSISAGGGEWSDFDLAPQLSAGTIGNNQHVTLTLHVPASATPGQHAGTTIDSDDQATNTLWPVAIEVE